MEIPNATIWTTGTVVTDKALTKYMVIKLPGGGDAAKVYAGETVLLLPLVERAVEDLQYLSISVDHATDVEKAKRREVLKKHGNYYRCDDYYFSKEHKEEQAAKEAYNQALEKHLAPIKEEFKKNYEKEVKN